MGVPSDFHSQIDNDPSDNKGNSTSINTVNMYQLCSDAYSGQGGFKNGSYLIEHEREKNFSERCGYSYYLNYFAPILDSLVDPVFKRPPEREYNSDIYDKFIVDCDNKKTDLTDFMSKTAKQAKKDGVSFVVMDSAKEQPVSKAEMVNNRTFPYVYMKKAIDVVLWEMTKHGQIISITFKESSGVITKGAEKTYHYRKWFYGGWELYAKYGSDGLENKIDSGVVANNAFAVIPVLMAVPDEEQYLPVPPLYGIATINAAIYNLSSELRELQRKQGFGILALPQTGNGGGNKQKEIGTTQGLGYPHDSKHKPEFISADVAIQDGYQKDRKVLTDEIYKQAKLAGVTGVLQQSGIAKQWDFEATDTALRFTARAVEGAEKDIISLFGDMIGTEISYDKISYPEDFGIKDVEDEITQASGVIDLGMPESVVKEAKKSVVAVKFAHLEPEKRDELLDDVDAMEELPPITGDVDKRIDVDVDA